MIYTSFIQSEYIREYNKENYQQYQIRVRKDNTELIQALERMENRNQFIINALEDKLSGRVLTLKTIKERILPILHNHGIKDIYLFGSYSRGEATRNSDVDIFCDKGNIRTLYEQEDLVDELESALDKKVDLVFDSSRMNEFFLEQVKKDRIKLC